MIVNVLICLIILTSQCVCVHSKVIIVNSNNGNNNTECCVNGGCACSLLSTALLNIDNNTIINITSELVALNNTIKMGSGKLTNITITGSNVTVMCNNSGSVYCESCDDVMIEGITWDRCGDPNGTNIAGVTFNGISNISLVSCTFQYSQLSAVALLKVTDNILIQGCKFLSNMLNIPLQLTHQFAGVLSITRDSSEISNYLNIMVTISESYFCNNGYLQNITDNPGLLLSPLYISITDSSVTNFTIIFNNTKFISNRNAVIITLDVFQLINVQLTEVLLFNNSVFNGYVARIGLTMFSYSGDVVLSIMSSTFVSNEGSDISCTIIGNKMSVTVNNSNFTNSALVDNSTISTVGIHAQVSDISAITFYRVQFNHNVIGFPKLSTTDEALEIDARGIVSVITTGEDIEIKMHMVNFTSNKYLGGDGGALYIFLQGDNRNSFNIYIEECQFVGNKSPGHGAALYIYTDFNDGYIQINHTNFDQNVGGSSILYITQDGFTQDNNKIQLLVNTSAFTNNTASSMYLSTCEVKLSGELQFMNNTAENGGAIYLDQGTTVIIESKTILKFISNTATLNGGAIYVDFRCLSYNLNSDTIMFFNHNSDDMSSKYGALFINNSARVAGNSLYFNIPKFCSINANSSDYNSFLYTPCQFNYSQPVNGKMMNISCDLDYTLLNGTGAPIVTSPHELRLYFPFNDGLNISSTSDHNIYFIRNHILGHPVKFTGAVFDYLGKPTEPAQFNIQLQCPSYTHSCEYTLKSGNRDHILTRSIDNYTVLSVLVQGKEINTTYINVTLALTSLSSSFNKINTTLVVKLVPCTDHPGYTYNEESQTCVCYHHNVKCSDDGNEIKRGYWIGSIDNKTTTSLCPNHYCNFKDRKQTSEGYSQLPNTINAQCNHHRVGRACGKCSSGYTLSYDSTDCISVDQCGAGWTVLVITLTCLYWIAVVAGVFSSMYFRFQISLGHLYGLIYYYSMIVILLNNNPYVSDDAFSFVSILSSFAQLTPQFLGKLCFVKGLSGIDQLFIQYSHAVGVSFLLLLIVVATRCSARISLFVSRCIIRVICLLILLSYTSIASTSLQLLLPLKFTDIKEWYTYSSPHIQYFHGRHAIYGVMAIICELIVVGLSLLLLLEPILSKKFNFIKIKPLLDQFQGCYKDKYRCFAAYYLICRQVIFLIVYIFNSNYSNMLFYLQTACVVIAVIHIWFQPYHSELLNALDGVMLLVMVLVVNINTFTFLQDVTTKVSLLLVMLPLFLFCTTAVKKIVHTCVRRKYGAGARGSYTHQYRQIDISDNENVEQQEAIRR